ncbi:hypothetical protein AQUCO_00100091v1 [Aquilegia coerulea]|uniref:Uncharacterized protein n=1 Tax=Aquilegia coerulea TaxID=218851 RepID=A0A2G5F8P6_AQUCA|nr:hypothetical protein AQUCO_00100091v1 [Aquilegia coerulea]
MCLLATMKRWIDNMKRSPRVADENMFNRDEIPRYVDEYRPRYRWNNLSALYSMIQGHGVNGADGVWIAGGIF